MRVDAGGNVRFAGSLADGTKVSQSAPISKSGLWPLYVPLYSGQGLLISWQAFTNQSGSDLGGVLDWIKLPNLKSHFYAGGFTNECEAMGSGYLAVKTGNILNFTSGRISFDGGNLPSDFTNTVTIVNNKVSNSSTNKLSLSFSTSTGIFHGKVTDPLTGKSSPFGGAVLQKMDAGYGYSLGVNKTSRDRGCAVRVSTSAGRAARVLFVQSQDFTSRFRDHGMMPRRVPDNFDRGFVHIRQRE